MNDNLDVFDIIKLETIEDVPELPFPIYVAAREGVYLSKTMAIGKVLLKETRMPDNFNSMGEYKDGYFKYTAPRIPATIISQALDFFRAVFQERNAEAEVLILFNEETKEFQLLPPYQYVTHGSVDSIYDQAHIPPELTTIGTIHSHCDFGAFHSGIDEGDARGFNGIHITIGHVNTDNPSFAAMAMINKEQFTFKLAEHVAEIEGDLDLLTAPQEWLNTYILDSPAEVMFMEWPTLTKESLEAFVRQAMPPVVAVVNNNKNDNKKDDRSDWRGWIGDGEYSSYGGVTRYSAEFNRSFDAKYFEGSSYANAKIKEECFEEVLTIELEKLFSIAAKHDIFLQYSLINRGAADDAAATAE